MKQAKVIVSGFVQGVGFRHFIRTRARELKLGGQVQNLPDGRVEAVFIGDEEKIQQAIQECKKGPFLSGVENVSVEWLSETEETPGEFEIINS